MNDRAKAKVWYWTGIALAAFILWSSWDDADKDRIYKVASATFIVIHAVKEDIKSDIRYYLEEVEDNDL